MTSFAQTTTVFFIARFVVGFFGFGISNTFFVLLTENCERKYREVLAVAYNMAYAVGLFGVSALVGLHHDIRTIGLVLAVLSVALIVICR
jgi:MFS family permease